MIIKYIQIDRAFIHGGYWAENFFAGSFHREVFAMEIIINPFIGVTNPRRINNYKMSHSCSSRGVCDHFSGDIND